jgi:hypothetical protein
MTEPLEQYPREDCYFCDEDTDVLEEHHLVPRRKGGSDNNENLVQVCPTCHQKLERLYDDRFYKALGASDPEDVITYALEYVLSELDGLEFELSTQLQDARSRIETLQSEEVLEDEAKGEIREYVADAMTEYYTDNSSQDDNPSGTSKMQRERMLNLKDEIDRLEHGNNEGVPIEQIVEAAKEYDMDESKIKREIENLRRKGEVWEPKPDHLSNT